MSNTILPQPQVTVIVPCRNEVKHIQGCIDAIFASDYLTNAIEVIIVDGLSDDGTREALNTLQVRYSQLNLIDNVRQLTPFAFNLGIHQAQGEYILIVGVRQLLAPNYISTCIQILQSPQIGCVGGIVHNIYENQHSRRIAWAMSSSFGVGLGNFRAHATDSFVDTAPTPCYRKQIFDEIGYFDEDLVRNQDDEFNYRVRKANYQIFQTAKTFTQYYVRANYKQLWRQYRQYGYWKVYVNCKHKAITTLRQVVPAMFVSYLFTLPILIYLHPGFIGLLILYGCLACFFAFKKSNQFFDLLGIIQAFVIMHLAYGLGYLEGLYQFVLLKRSPDKKHSQLSR